VARLLVNLDAVRHNARLIADLCSARGVLLTGVTKGVLADPPLVRVLVEEGIHSLADSRLANIARIRETGVAAELHLIRAPGPEELPGVLDMTDASYHSELRTIRELASLAHARGTEHRVVLMVDVGDRREGLMPGDVLEAAREVLDLKGACLHGLGMNVGCASGVQPTPANMGLLASLAQDVQDQLGCPVPLVSGGSSLAMPLLVEGRVPQGVNHFRVGCAIWLGDYNTWDEPVPGARHDGFDLRATIIELKWKPSLPEGEIGVDAFGCCPSFEDRGPMLRAICSLGKQDIYLEGIEPLLPGARVVTASSDHLILDVTTVEPPPQVGDEVRFRMNYGAMLYAMQSGYVIKKYLGKPAHA
jgi:predicted amino acid racemase